MVNVNKLSAEMQKELAFTKEELAELEQAKKMPITLMRIARKRLRNVH